MTFHVRHQVPRLTSGLSDVFADVLHYVLEVQDVGIRITTCPHDLVLPSRVPRTGNHPFCKVY
jgi:hypothetical protein